MDLDWLKEHSVRLLSFALTCLTAANLTDPSDVAGLFSDEGARWFAFVLATSTFAHVILFAAPGVLRRGRPGDPPVSGS